MDPMETTARLFFICTTVMLIELVMSCTSCAEFSGHRASVKRILTRAEELLAIADNSSTVTAEAEPQRQNGGI